MNSASSSPASSSAQHDSPSRVGRRRRLFLASALVLLLLSAARAEPANGGSAAELQGRALAQKILALRPAENATNTGSLTIRAEAGPRRELPVTCETVVTATNWLTRYQARFGTNPADVTTLVVTHAGAAPNHYLLYADGKPARAGALEFQAGAGVSGSRTMIPFAGSDFWLCDLGLEFFHWPLQQVVKKEFHRNCPCTVLESTNPDPSANGYSRVVCWIDDDSLGIVEAYAYDAKGRKLKNFYPKNLEKVHGRYQVGSMVMDNLQTGSRSRLDFDLNQ